MWKFADKIVTQSLPNGQCPSSFRTLSGVILISECAVAAGRRTFDRIGNHLNILITAVTLETKEGGFRFGPHHLSGWFGIQTLDARELLEEAVLRSHCSSGGCNPERWWNPEYRFDQRIVENLVRGSSCRGAHRTPSHALFFDHFHTEIDLIQPLLGQWKISENEARVSTFEYASTVHELAQRFIWSSVWTVLCDIVGKCQLRNLR